MAACMAKYLASATHNDPFLDQDYPHAPGRSARMGHPKNLDGAEKNNRVESHRNVRGLTDETKRKSPLALQMAVSNAEPRIGSGG